MDKTLASINLSSIRDNRDRGSVGKFLRDNIKSESDLSIVSAYFTIYAYNQLKEQLNSINELKFLFGEPTFIKSIDPNKTNKRDFKIEDDKIIIPIESRLTQKSIARECSEWIKSKVEIKSMVKPNFLHGKKYHITQQSGVEKAIVGSSNFTVNGLGLGGSPNIELNLVVDNDRDRADLKEWFKELWNDETGLVEDVKSQVLKYLEQLWVENEPEFIYFKTLFHIFENYLNEQQKGGLLNEQTGFFESEIWNMLYDFQKDGTKGAINKILRHNGCIIADSVGLGKTFEALAVIRYFELLNYRVLVLCPNEVLDLEDMNESVSLTDFTLDDFRIELLNFIENNRKRLEDAPFGLYAVVPSPSGLHKQHLDLTKFSETEKEVIKSGVVYCLKQKGDTDGNEDVNPLQPYFLVYIREDGQVRFNYTSAKQILEIYRLMCAGKAEPFKQLCDLFNSETKQGEEMNQYTELIEKSVEEISHVFNKRSNQKITGNDRGALLIPESKRINDINNFELVTWLVIK